MKLKSDEIAKLIEVAECVIYERTGEKIESIDKQILEQVLLGKKNDDIEVVTPKNKTYSKKYIQTRYIPDFWRRFSTVLGQKVNKRNFLEVLQAIQMQREQQEVVAQNERISKVQTELNDYVAQNGSGCHVVNGKLTLLSKQMRVPSQVDNLESEKASEGPYNSRLEGILTIARSSRSDNRNQAKNSNVSWISFLQPGVPLLLSAGGLSCLFTFSWLANWYGLINYVAGELPKAQLGYSLALKFNPSSAGAHYNQGLLYEDQQNYTRAREEYQQAIEGGLVEAYNNQSRLDILERKYDAAVSLLNVGLPLAKDKQVKYAIYKNRGWARLEQGHIEEAQVDLREAIKIISDRPAPYCLLARVLEHRGKNSDAIEEWENCVRFASQRMYEKYKQLR